jgi:flagellar motility protein MotE (MotC chaperone)
MTQRFRLFPIVIVTAVAVLGFKVSDLVRQDGMSFNSISTALAQEKPAEKPAGKEAAQAEMKKEGKAAKKDEKQGSETPVEQVVTNLSQSEIALLEALSNRRKELDAREKKADLRLTLLKAAEKRIDDKIRKLEKIRDEIELRTGQQKKLRDGKFKKLVSIYEGMKPKEAARIFSRLDGKVVLQVAERIAPRKMSAILAKMDADAAERLTIQLAAKAAGEDQPSQELPRIDNGKAG